MYRKFYLVLLENVKLQHLKKKKVNCPSDIQDSVWNVVLFFFFFLRKLNMKNIFSLVNYSGYLDTG